MKDILDMLISPVQANELVANKVEVHRYSDRPGYQADKTC